MTDGAASGESRRRHAKSRDRWDLILSVATRLFDERGFAATSMHDISDAAGLQRGSLYYYVKSKEALLFDILRDLHRGGEALVEHVDFDTADPVGELRAFLVQIGIYSGKHADRLRIFDRDLQYLTVEEQQDIIRERSMYRQTAERLLGIAIRNGQLSPALDLTVAAQTLFRAVAGISDWYRPGGTLQIEQVAVQVAGILIQGLLGYDPGQQRDRAPGAQSAPGEG